MTELLTRVRGYFLETDEAEEPSRLPQLPAGPAALGLVGCGSSTVATAAVLALALARAQGARCAALCRFGASPAGVPAVPSARRSAAECRQRELTADASGRLVRVMLDENTALLAQTIAEIADAVPGPAVLALDRPRDDAVDAVLAGQEAIAWVAHGDAPGCLGDLVASSLHALGPPAFPIRPPGPLARRLALAGLLAPGISGVGLSALEGSNPSGTLARGSRRPGEGRAGPMSYRAAAGPTEK